MKTCKDCIHYDICLGAFGDWLPKICDSFKDKSKFIELPCSIGDITYAIAYTENTRPVEVRVFQIIVNEHEVIIWIESIKDKTDFWRLTADQYNEWAKFSTQEEAKKKLEEFK